jgi:ribosomal protein L40E
MLMDSLLPLLDLMAQVDSPRKGTTTVLVVAGVVVLLLVKTAKQHRRHSAETDQRLCRACGAAHPPFAAFCRRCGKKL